MKIHSVALTILLCGCASPRPGVITVETEVAQFVPQALHEDYVDGRWATYDAIVFRILSPPHWSGTNLTVYCHPEDTNVVFKTTGDRFRFDIREEYLMEKTTDPKTGTTTVHNLFIGALQDATTIGDRTSP